MAEIPAFDPSKPFETISGAPPFDPSKPYEQVQDQPQPNTTFFNMPEADRKVSRLVPNVSRIMKGLSAFGEGFSEGMGPEHLGLNNETPAWQKVKNDLINYNIIPKDANDYTNPMKPFMAFNEAFIRPLAVGIDTIVRSPGALYRGLQNLGKAGGLPSDIVSIPDAFLGSPSPMGIPRINMAPPKPFVKPVDIKPIKINFPRSGQFEFDPNKLRSEAAKTGDPLVDAILDHPVLKEVINNPVVDDAHTIPNSLGGSTPVDNPTLYRDKDFPKTLTVDGVTFDTAEPSAVHENVEEFVIDALVKGGMDQATALKVAFWNFGEVAEDAWYRSHGIDPEKVEAKYTEHLDRIAARPIPDSAPVGFKTAKGSTYELHDDGTTTRNKAARSDVGHEGDFGPKKRSAKTVYVDSAELASELSAAGLQGLGSKGARVIIKDGKASLLTWNEQAGKWGRTKEGTDIPVHDEPAVGRAPLELWKPADDVPGWEAYRGMHAGNVITEMTGGSGVPPDLFKGTYPDGDPAKAGPGPIDKPTPEETALGRQMLEKYLAGPAEDIGGGITAFHGSSAKFEKFDISKIGTGEGAQAYGHGLYFAENEGVARSYMREPFSSKPAGGGVLYKVRINADPEHFLDLDKTLSEQNPKIASAFEKVWNDLGEPPPRRAWKDMHAQEAYEYLSGRDGQEAASKALSDAGIPGIKYLDQGSRPSSAVMSLLENDVAYLEELVKSQPNQMPKLEQAKERLAQATNAQTRNYVVFDDNLVQITHVNGQPILDAARDLGVIGPPKLPLTEGKPSEAAARAVGGDGGGAQKPPTGGTGGGPPGGAEPPQPTGNPWRDRFEHFVGKLETPEDVKQFIREAADEKGEFPVARQGDIKLSHVERIAEAAGVETGEINARGLGRDLKNDAEVEIAIRLMLQAADNMKTAAREVRATRGQGGTAQVKAPAAPVAGKDYAANADPARVGEVQGGGIHGFDALNGEVRLVDGTEIPVTQGADTIWGPGGSQIDPKIVSAFKQGGDWVVTKNKQPPSPPSVGATAEAQALIKLQESIMRRDLAVEQVVGLRAEWGRTGNAIQKFLTDVKDQEGLSNFLKDKGRSPKDLADIADAIDSLDKTQAARLMNDLRTPTGWDKFMWYYVNSLISGLVTHGKYVIANGTFAGAESAVVTPVAGVVGTVRRSLLGGSEGVFVGEAGARIWGLVAGTPDAIVAAAKAARTGLQTPLPGEIAQNIAPKSKNVFQQAPIGGPIGTLIGLPSRGASAIHSFFNFLGYRASLEAQAYRYAASTEGLSPIAGDFWERRQNVVDAPTKEMMDNAIEEGYRLTYINELGPAGKAISRGIKATKLGQLIMPFTHIPFNILSRGIDYTPAAFLPAETRADLFGKNGAVKQDMAIARVVVGSAVGAWAVNMVANDRMTGYGPTDPKERAQWLATGHQPYSVRIGDEWLSFNRFGSLGTMLGLHSNLAEAIPHLKPDSEELTKALIMTVHSTGRLLEDEVGFQGLAGLIDAINDPARNGARYISNLAGGLLPMSSFQRQTASSMDPYMRETKTVVDGLRYYIPVVRQDLLPKRDWLGEPITNAGYGGDLPIPGLSSVIQHRPAEAAPIAEEMKRLDLHPAVPADRIAGVKLPPKLYDQYQVMAGELTRQVLYNWVAQPNWYQMPEFVRAEVFRRSIAASRQQAGATMMGMYPQIIQQGVQQRIDQINGVKPTKLQD